MITANEIKIRNAKSFMAKTSLDFLDMVLENFEELSNDGFFVDSLSFPVGIWDKLLEKKDHDNFIDLMYLLGYQMEMTSDGSIKISVY